MEPYRVGILGATGLVGQHLARLLADHAWFRLAAVGASDRSVGRAYGDAARWSLPGQPPPGPAVLTVQPCEPRSFSGCDLVFSALDATAAAELEPRFAAGGFAVISNSSAHRQRDEVPLVIPEVNAAHLELIAPRVSSGERGYIVTNPNCTATGLALALAPIHRALGVRRVVVATLQALSGAGVNGPRGMELVDNVLPHIPGEEEKLEVELNKIFGTLADGRITPADMVVSAHCHRVATVDGHLEAVSVETREVVGPRAASELLERFRGDTEGMGLPTAPEAPIVVRREPDRPQPRLDRHCGRGMSVVVGRVRGCPVLGLKLELLSHNAMRGAAGGALLNAELLAARDRLPRRGGG
jgi:aspartate-semialdehyde dehydrogenase